LRAVGLRGALSDFNPTLSAEADDVVKPLLLPIAPIVMWWLLSEFRIDGE
jgi:hypothetical protein